MNSKQSAVKNSVKSSGNPRVKRAGSSSSKRNKSHLKKRSKIKRTAKKISRKAAPVIRVWRIVAALVIFMLISPAFMATHSKDHFYSIVLSATALFIGLISIIERPLKKGFREYFRAAKALLLIGGGFLIIGAFTPVYWVKISFLLLSALFYSFAMQRLGLTIFITGL